MQRESDLSSRQVWTTSQGPGGSWTAQRKESPAKLRASQRLPMRKGTASGAEGFKVVWEAEHFREIKGPLFSVPGSVILGSGFYNSRFRVFIFLFLIPWLWILF